MLNRLTPEYINVACAMQVYPCIHRYTCGIHMAYTGINYTPGICTWHIQVYTGIHRYYTSIYMYMAYTGICRYAQVYIRCMQLGLPACREKAYRQIMYMAIFMGEISNHGK